MDTNKLVNIIPSDVLTQIPNVINTFTINNPLRLAHFLSQCAHESGNFKVTTENLNYSAQGLLNTFPKYFSNKTIAAEFARKPVQIANRVYGSRMGNGAESSGDGFRYRGRGYIQLTGKVNYQAFDKFVDDDIIANPDLVATKYPLLSAAWFWNSRNLNTIADTGSTELIVTNITKRVNGGTNGLEDRIKKFNKYYSVLTDS